MACCLVARNGQRYLSPRAVVARLVSEFPSVTSSEEDGRRYVRGIIERLVAIRRSGDSPVDNEYLERLAKAENGAIYVYFEDWSSANVYLGMVIIPGEPIFFTYSSITQEQAAHPLLVRCAKVLDYEIVDA
jgi:hypothetical protein